MRYLPRIADGELETRLRVTGAVVIEGPKACGKTATARQVAASEVLFDVDEQARAAARLDASLVLEGATPRLIDEWQIEPSIWNHVRRAVDDRGEPGQFILTGSAVPADDVTRHTGAGRLTRLRMRPLSLFESGHSSGDVSLRGLFEDEPARGPDRGMDLRGVAERVCAGGWPGFRRLDAAAAARAVRDYLAEVRRVDITRVDGVRRDPALVGRVLRSIARNVSTEATLRTLSRDAVGGDDGSPHVETVRSYLGALERLMVVEDQPPWAPHLRSKAVLRRSSKRHFTDPSLAAAALGASPDALLRDVELLGFLFESMAVRDLRVYAQPLDARVLHYRDNYGIEVDAIVETADGRWGAVEIKLGQGRIDQAAEGLLRFREQVDTDRSGTPAFLAVVVGGGYAYRRPDGVDVVPLTALGP